MKEIHVVFDETALVATGRGNIAASTLIDLAHADPSWHLYAPACALVQADRVRPGTASHLASLPALVFLDLDLVAALSIADKDTWGHAHARFAAAPDPERPDGAAVATLEPTRWTGETVRVLDLNP